MLILKICQRSYLKQVPEETLGIFNKWLFSQMWFVFDTDACPFYLIYKIIVISKPKFCASIHAYAYWICLSKIFFNKEKTDRNQRQIFLPFMESNKV